MANIASQIKRNRQNEKRRLRNRDSRGAARNAVKTAFTAIESNQDSKAAVAAAIVALDKAARKGSIHHRNAARRKSRLVRRLTAMGQVPVAAAPKAVEPKPVVEKKVAEPKAKKTTTKTAAKKAPAKKTTKK